jgi:hypothetical protein
MKLLLQRISTFLLHVVEAPETALETREAAEELARDVTDAINGNYREDEDDSDEH